MKQTVAKLSLRKWRASYDQCMTLDEIAAMFPSHISLEAKGAGIGTEHRSSVWDSMRLVAAARARNRSGR